MIHFGNPSFRSARRVARVVKEEILVDLGIDKQTITVTDTYCLEMNLILSIDKCSIIFIFCAKTLLKDDLIN